MSERDPEHAGRPVRRRARSARARRLQARRKRTNAVALTLSLADHGLRPDLAGLDPVHHRHQRASMACSWTLFTESTPPPNTARRWSGQRPGGSGLLISLVTLLARRSACWRVSTWPNMAASTGWRK